MSASISESLAAQERRVSSCLQFGVADSGMEHDFRVALLNSANHPAKSFGIEMARHGEAQKVIWRLQVIPSAAE